MDGQNKWNDIVIKAILALKEFDIKEVNNFESIQALLFDREKYPTIISLIKDERWESLKEFENEKKNDPEIAFIKPFKLCCELSFE